MFGASKKKWGVFGTKNPRAGPYFLWRGCERFFFPGGNFGCLHSYMFKAVITLSLKADVVCGLERFTKI